ncbi:MAG: hypothetical protein ACOVMG_03985 [Flavobacterium sp.]
MGKLKGIIQFTGQIEGLSFYEMNGKIIVRKTGGFDGEKIKNDAKYVRVRENSSEFSHCATIGKYFRKSLHIYLKKLTIPYVHNRVLGLFQEISRLDLVSARGKRTVFNGLQSLEAKEVLERFEFDKNLPFDTVFPFVYGLDLLEGRLVVSNFSTRLLKKVTGATHVNLKFIVVGLDFENQTPYIQNSSAAVTVSLQDTSESDMEIHCEIPQSPFVFGLLYLEFFQRVNDVDYDLKVGALKILGFR